MDERIPDSHAPDGMSPSSDREARWVDPAEDDRIARRARWRIVFGTLSLVVGVLGFCVQGSGSVMVAFGDVFWKMGGLEVPPPPPVVTWGTMLQFAVLAVLGVMLIVGSAMILRKNPKGRSVLLAWVVGRLVMVVVSIAFAVVTIKPQVDWQIEIVSAIREGRRQQPNVTPENLSPIPDRAAAEAQAIRTVAIFSLFFATWPFVMAIVLTRPHVKEEVESWRSGGATPVA
jgi:hypothetical protein